MLDWFQDSFLKSASSCFHKDSNWLQLAIPQSARTQSFSYFEYLFSHLKPSFRARMDILLKISGPLAFADVVEMYAQSVTFGSEIETLLGPLTDTSGAIESELGNWGLSLFEDFTTYQKGFASYERSLLLSALSQSLEDSRRTSNHVVSPKRVS
jgi:hypothetical protein